MGFAEGIVACGLTGKRRISNKELAVNQSIGQQSNMKRTLLIVAGIVVLGLAGCPDPGRATAADKNPVVEMDTSMGKVKIELFADRSPITVKNFLDYVDKKQYDGLTFHRVMPEFMIQGGGFEPGLKDAKNEQEVNKLEKKTGTPIKNESDNGVSNERGTLAMARTGDPNSATAQFFINVVDNKKLDAKGGRPGYAVFGKVVEGMDVVDKIKDVKTKTVIPELIENVPVEEVIIKSIRRVEK
jgi:cyclophilin family peptidyl-prolyl cis-trans isomerase